MNIQTKNSQFHVTKKGSDFVLDFGILSKGVDTTTALEFTGEKLSKVEVVPTCGCTAVSANQGNGMWTGQVRYKNTHILGEFSKTIIVKYNEGGKDFKTNLKIKGKVQQHD